MSRRSCFTRLGLGIALLCASVSNAAGAILRAGDLLQIGFTTNPPFAENKNPNVLTASLGYTNRLQPYTAVCGALYDGSMLLGVSVSTSTALGGYTGVYSYHPFPATWTTANSPWSFPNPDEPAIVDFTSMQNGTINGLIELQINAGSFEFNFNDVYLSFILATYANGGESIPPYSDHHVDQHNSRGCLLGVNVRDCTAAAATTTAIPSGYW